MPDTPDHTAAPMKRRTAAVLMRGIVQAVSDGEDADRCTREAVALLEMVAARGLTDGHDETLPWWHPHHFADVRSPNET